MNIVFGIFGAFAQVVGRLGVGGTFMAAAGLLLVYLLLKFVERADRVFERLQRRWQRFQPATRWSLIVAVLVLLGPSLWAAFPKSAGALALCGGLYAAYALQGWRFIQQYDLHDTTFWQAWNHHLDVSRAARRHTAALGDATTKKGGRARRPTVTPDGMVTVVEPPHGMSADETVEAYNAGQMNSSLAERFGWGAVADVAAEPVGDGTVRVHMTATTPEKDDFFSESFGWPGMEKP